MLCTGTECVRGWNVEHQPLKIRQRSSNIIIFMPNFKSTVHVPCAQRLH